jgi:pimeloyl-ACP methyl ester carboxylesterase
MNRHGVLAGSVLTAVPFALIHVPGTFQNTAADVAVFHVVILALLAPSLRYLIGTVLIDTGDGPTDLILVPGFVSQVEMAWEEPRLAHFLSRLASFLRLIVFDKRGTGMSDPVSNAPWMDERMDDIRVVLDRLPAGTVFGISEGGTLSLLFARAHLNRCESIILYGSWARRLIGPGAAHRGPHPR